MAALEVGIEAEFEFDLDTIEEIADAGPENDWNAYLVSMRDIQNGSKLIADDGSHEIPFWAMLPFWEYCTSLKKDGGWCTANFRRKQHGDKSTAVFK